MRLNGICGLIILIIALNSPLNAGSPGTSAVDFLNISVSARNAATGGALSALSDGPISSYYNPAGLTESNNIQIAGMHSEWLQDLRYEFLGLAMPAGSQGAFGLYMSYLGMGEINGYNSSNVPIGNISAYDWSLGVSYARRFSSSLSLGVGVKTINEKLADFNTRGYAGDIGLQYRSNSYGIGLSLMNLGPKIKYASASSPLPTKADAGFAYWPFGGNLALLAGLAMPFNGSPSFRTGLEYTYAKLLTFRSGYGTAERVDSHSGLSFGAGLNVLSQSLDYAFNTNGLFGGTHQLSFTLRFGQPRERSFSSIKAPANPQPSGTNGSVSESGHSGKVTYLVCAGRYSNRSDAQQHCDLLSQFGLTPKLSECGQSEYRVVLSKTGDMAKAEEMKNDFGKRGITCFIEEE